MAVLALGLMSGTSCDGVSAALVRFPDRPRPMTTPRTSSAALTLMAHRTTPYPSRVSQRLRRAAASTAPEFARLNVELGARFARAALALLRRARVSPSRVTVIGSHGHTIYHGPRERVPSTLQLGEPAVIAERTGLPVVAQFRMRDLAAGGEGAPLIPAFDEAVFGGGPVRALQNIGGIANVTIVGRGMAPLAFDTGPGNCLMDLVAQRMGGGRRLYDAGGRLAAGGRVDAHALTQLMRHPYLHRRPPKSTGRETFDDSLLQRVFGARLRRDPRGVLATLNAFTALSIVESYRRFAPAAAQLSEVIVSGGGARNLTLIRHLMRLLTPVPVRSIEAYGIPTQAKEPAAFAWLALRALQGRPNHLPATTGARHACILGSILPGRSSSLTHSLTAHGSLI